MDRNERFGRIPRLLAVAVLTSVVIGLPVWYGSTVPALFEIAFGYRPEWPTHALERVVPLTDRSGARERWEVYYMYGVSALGGILVLLRFVRDWRFDRDRLAFVPRTRRRTLPGLWRQSARAASNDHDADHGRQYDG